MSNYVENFRGKLDLPKPFQRTGKFPLDRSDLFSSYADAVLYAAGDRTNPDSRGLCGTSYVGQIITVYENGVVTVYKINADRSLSELRSSDCTLGTVSGVLAAGSLSLDLTVPELCTIVSTIIRDKVTGETLLTDVCCTGTTVTISVAEAYVNDLDIVVSYRI